MFEKVLAVVALLTLAAFVGVVVWFVPELDLAIVTIVVLGMAAFDFYLVTFRKKNSGK